MNEYKVNMPYMAPAANAPVPGQSEKRVALIATVAAVIFGLLFIIFLGLFLNISSKYRAAYNNGVTSGKADQSTIDNEKLRLALETPYRTYVAPDTAGAFEVTYPKSWSMNLSEEGNGSTIGIILHPDYIRTSGGEANQYATRVAYATSRYSDQVAQYNNMVKAGSLAGKQIVISGVTGMRFDGKFNGRFDGAITVLQVRDKTLTISTEDKRYFPEYNQILAQLKIRP